MTYQSETEANAVKQAIQRLANHAHAVMSAEAEEERAQASLRAVGIRVSAAREAYDTALEQVLAVFPQFGTGFNNETVEIGGDGQVHVVPRKE